MKKKPAYSFKPYYDRHRKNGWKQTAVFGPAELVEAVKVFVKKYKKEHDLYSYKSCSDKIQL